MHGERMRNDQGLPEALFMKKANQAADHRARFAVVRGLGFLWQTWHMCIGPFIGRVSVFAARLNNVMGVGFI